MKKIILCLLALSMVLSMAACGCDHQWEDATCKAPKTCLECGQTDGTPADHLPGELTVSAVDTDKLTITHNLPCSVCGEVIETKTSATGIAPVNGVIHISPNEWFTCLLSNIQALGASQSLFSYPVASEDNALLYSVVSMSPILTVFSFQDPDGNVITTDGADVRGSIHNIRIDAQFTNDNAQEFFMLLMIVLINNNSALDYADANTLCGQIMGGQTVTDNGYTYAMEIVSVEEHKVCVSITAE